MKKRWKGSRRALKDEGHKLRRDEGPLPWCIHKKFDSSTEGISEKNC